MVGHAYDETHMIAIDLIIDLHALSEIMKCVLWLIGWFSCSTEYAMEDSESAMTSGWNYGALNICDWQNLKFTGLAARDSILLVKTFHEPLRNDSIKSNKCEQFRIRMAWRLVARCDGRQFDIHGNAWSNVCFKPGSGIYGVELPCSLLRRLIVHV